MHTIICGDNLEKLDLVENDSVDFIYIDPPYGTLGKKGNKYNDYFATHEDWQAFIKPRLSKGFAKLKDTGCIAISIDNVNLAYLLIVCNEVCGEKNFVNTFIWLKQKTNKNSSSFNTDHEYIVVYAKNIKKVVINKEILDVANDKRYKYTDERASYFLQPNTNIQPAYGGGDNKEPIELNTYWNQDAQCMGMGRSDNYDPLEINSYQLKQSTLVESKNNEQRYKEPFELNTHRTISLDDDGKGGTNNNNAFALNPSEVSAALDYKSGKNQQAPIELNTYRNHSLDNILAERKGYSKDAIELNTYDLSSAENSISVDGQCRTITKKAPIELNGHMLHALDNDMCYAQPPIGVQPIEHETILIKPRTSWRWCKEKIDWALKENLVVFKKNKSGEWKVYFKQYKYLTTAKVNGKYCLVPIERTKPYSTIIEGCTNDRALAKVFGSTNKFHYSKPVKLIEHLLKIFTSPNDTVLDFFAGSGTTAHAANNLNRNSISIQNNENNIFTDILVKRLDFYNIKYEVK